MSERKPGWLTIRRELRCVLLECSDIDPDGPPLTQACTAREARALAVALRERGVRLEVVDGRRRVVHELDYAARLEASYQLDDCAAEIDGAMDSTGRGLLLPT
jgi:hypothetical protein